MIQIKPDGKTYSVYDENGLIGLLEPGFPSGIWRFISTDYCLDLTAEGCIVLANTLIGLNGGMEE